MVVANDEVTGTNVREVAALAVVANDDDVVVVANDEEIAVTIEPLNVPLNDPLNDPVALVGVLTNASI